MKSFILVILLSLAHFHCGQNETSTTISRENLAEIERRHAQNRLIRLKDSIYAIYSDELDSLEELALENIPEVLAIETLYNESKNNQLKAQNKYDNINTGFSGVVSKTGRSLSGNGIVELRSQNKDEAHKFSVDVTVIDEADVIELSNGDRRTFLGKLGYVNILGVWHLRDANLYRPVRSQYTRRREKIDALIDSLSR